jgi:hypothetical protein
MIGMTDIDCGVHKGLLAQELVKEKDNTSLSISI